LIGRIVVWVVAAFVALAMLVAFVRMAQREQGWPHRFVQDAYLRLGSIASYRKSGAIHRSVLDAFSSGGKSLLVSLVERVSPRQAGWLHPRFPTDKGNYHDYLRLYDALFAPYREHPGVRLLEVGVKKGGSLALWREAFDETSFIYGIDVDPRVPRFERDPHIQVWILDSRDAALVGAAVRGLQFDIIIDDGLHTAAAQRDTFLALSPHLKPTGVYVIEDVHRIDETPFRERAFDVTVHPDRSGQGIVVLYPPDSLARRTSVWSRGQAIARAVGKAAESSLRGGDPPPPDGQPP
jgi:hypothetical protein